MGKRVIILIIFAIWSTVILSTFYISQRPLAFQVISGASATLWSILLTLILLFDSAGLGYFIIKHLQLQPIGYESFILGAGLGLGILGLMGYALGAFGLSKIPVLLFILIGISFWIFLARIHRKMFEELFAFVKSIQESKSDVIKWIPPVVFFTGSLSFAYTLLPPAEGFDGLLYHLRLPELLITDGRIVPYNNFPFWFPSLIEGDYVWALGLHSERTSQMLHWIFAMLSLALIWIWCRQAFGERSAWWSLAILASMPSLPLLSSWAYTDFGLIFFSLCCTYALWRWCETRKVNFLLLAGIFSGFAMGVKYTTFILPVFCVIFIFFYEKRFVLKIKKIFQYSAVSLLVASPWYLRNWILMGNPVYPFVFGGRYWDPFLSAWQSNAGSGIGWNLSELLILPINITMGYRDAVFYDGRMGPLFLLLTPFIIWILWNKFVSAQAEFKALLIPTLFFIINFASWTYGVIQTSSLWQSRYLWAGLFHLSIPIGLALSNLEKLNGPRIRLSFLANAFVGMVIAIALLDNTLFLIVRRPLLYSLGLESRTQYFERVQPEYSEALNLVNSTPKEAHIFFLFEPRSYNMNRNVQPDPINANLMHDYYRYNSATNVIIKWKASGYTHVLINLRGAEFIKGEGRTSDILIRNITDQLQLIKKLDYYALYAIP